jgi:hypothetical protein
MKVVLTMLAGGAALLGSAALAQGPVTSQQQDVRRVVVYGSEACPRGEAGEIIVCARRPEGDRYRIPEELRDTPDESPESESWAARAESLEYVGDTGTQSCSTVGPGGFTGCWEKMMREARRGRDVPAEGQPQP